MISAHHHPGCAIDVGEHVTSMRKLQLAGPDPISIAFALASVSGRAGRLDAAPAVKKVVDVRLGTLEAATSAHGA